MKKLFKIIGKPMGKQRPKFARAAWGVRTYTPEETANYEQLVKFSYMGTHKDFMFSDGDMIEALIEAYYAIPKSTTKKNREKMQLGYIRPTKKPDVDNITKIILDSLNGVAFKDDAQVTDVLVRKRYIEKDDMQPQVIVTLCNDGTLLK